MNEETRLSFFEFVSDQWGRERAGQLMDMLPPVGYADLATKQDLAVLGSELRQEMAELRIDLIDRMSDLTNRMADLTNRVADMTRILVIAMLTLWVSGIALAFVAARLGG
jgi:hypothetical protein